MKKLLTAAALLLLFTPSCVFVVKGADQRAKLRLEHFRLGSHQKGSDHDSGDQIHYMDEKK
ncbi:MAG: hypothetical protein H8E15_11435 [Planctomycetes bacterium]|nr:hypothetical protein [Planctomycetota bacterium]